MKKINLGVYILLFIFFLIPGVIFAPDSASYITKSVIRSPLYPVLLNFFSWIDDTYFILVVFQILLGLYSIFKLVDSLQEIFVINSRYMIIIVTGLFLIPYVGCVGNYLLSEGVAYPLFLLAFRSLLLGLEKNSAKYIAIFLLISGGLVLLRGQFLFMFVVGVAALIFIKNKNKYRLFGVLILIIVGSNILEKSYHKQYHDQFISTPFTGIHLLIAPLYYSEVEDIKYIRQEQHKNIFKLIREQIEIKKLSHNYAVGNIDMPYHYYASYDRIVYEVVFPLLTKISVTDFVVIEQITKAIAWDLFKNNWMICFIHYVKNFISYCGGYFNFLFVSFVFCGSLMFYYKNKKYLHLGMFFSSLLLIGNNILLAIVQSVHVRYSFYTEILFLVMLLLVFFQFFRESIYD